MKAVRASRFQNVRHLQHVLFTSMLLVSTASPCLGQEPSSDQLLASVRSGDAEAVQRLLREGADPNGADEQGMTPLTLATALGHVGLMRVLLDRGAVPDESALWTAMGGDRVEALRMLLEAGADPDGGPDGMTGEMPLQHAVSEGKEEVLALLLKAGADPDVSTTSGETTLRLAVDARERDLVRLLLEAGADPDGDPASNRDGYTPLLVAARSEQMDVAELLLAHGADGNYGYRGDTALDFAIEAEHPDLVFTLLQNGADPNRLAGVNDRETPLMRALEKDDPELVQPLFEAGGDPYIRSGVGQMVESRDGAPDRTVEYERVEIDHPDGVSFELERRTPTEEGRGEADDSDGSVTGDDVDPDAVAEVLPWVRRLSAEQAVGIRVHQDRLIVPKAEQAWSGDVDVYDILWLPERAGNVPPFERRVVDITEEGEFYVLHTYPAPLDVLGRRIGLEE